METKYPLSEQVRALFRQHGINSPELEAKLQDFFKGKPNEQHEEDNVPSMPVIEPSPEKALLNRMYPSLIKGRK